MIIWLASYPKSGNNILEQILLIIIIILHYYFFFKRWEILIIFDLINKNKTIS